MTEALVRHEVRIIIIIIIIVGGVAAVLQRAPINTEDLDLVHDRSPENVERLLAALAELNAVYRDDPRNLAPNSSRLLKRASAGRSIS